MGGRFLINGSGADENELPGPAFEQREIAFNVLRRKSDPIHDRVKLQVSQRGAGCFRLVDVGRQAVAARWIFRLQPAI